MRHLQYCLLFASALTFFVTGCSHLYLDEKSDFKTSLHTFGTKGEIQDTNAFYYYFDEKKPLNARNDLLLLQFQNNLSRNTFISGLSSVSSLKVWNPDGTDIYLRENSFNILVLQSTHGPVSREFFDEIQQTPDILVASYLFEFQGGLFAISNEFYVQLKHDSDYEKLLELVTNHGCSVEQHECSNKSIHYIRKPEDSEFGTVALANAFYETGLFVFSSPVFFLLEGKCSSDPNYSYQWGLKNTGQYGGTTGVDINVESAWIITMGSSSIVTAVVDDGVESTHPDLASNLLTGYDIILNQSGGVPQSSDDYHGTCVAGVIGAINGNNIGISGISPNSKILPIRVFNGPYTTDTILGDGITWAYEHGADVINCSWFSPYSCAVVSAINNATTLGRNGKGSVVVCSSGNDSSGLGSSVSFPAYLDKAIAVGAISYNGMRKTSSSPDGEYWGSNYGLQLDVVAPGVRIPTTAIQNTYTNLFAMTSSAAPHVAGIAALILSEYPDLTESQVRRAIELGCTYISGYTFQEDDNYPSGLWNNEVGYGRANAYNALLWAEFAHETNVTDGISGFDFTLTNHSSYDVYALFVGLTGDILNSNETLIFHDPGIVESGMQTGYPFYRGENLSATPGTTVSNMWLELFASTPNYYGNLRIGVSIDNSTPASYTNISFGDGDTVLLNLPNSTVPNASRRRVYIDVRDPL